MAKADHQIGHESIDAMLSVATLLETPRLAGIYTYVFQHGPATADELRDHLEMAQTTVYQDLNRLKDRGLLLAGETSPREHIAPPVSLTVETEGDSYTVTPALIAVIARRDEDPDIDLSRSPRHRRSRTSARLRCSVHRWRDERAGHEPTPRSDHRRSRNHSPGASGRPRRVR